MTRVLSELLGADDNRIQFHAGLVQLERSAGMPSHDIRLSTEIRHTVLLKLKQLGLDPHDTTGRELYEALGTRLRTDEKRFMQAILRGVKISEITHDPTPHVASALERELRGIPTYSLKNAAARKLLKANLPKKAMKVLGYRSADSMLKHESVASLFAAAWLVENDLWAKKTLNAYAKLKATDFESRTLAIDHPSSKRWQEFGDTAVAQKRHNVLAFKELGSIVLLPLPQKTDQPAFPALATATLALHAVNDVLSASSYLKLHQARPDFGAIVKDAVLHEPTLGDTILDRPVSWSLLQQYYADLRNKGEEIKTDLFEPFLAAQDLVWHGAEQILARIEPSLQFWADTSHAGHLDDGQAVSCNLTDNVLSHCNRLPFQERISSYFRGQLTAELLLRYMDQDRLERSITVPGQRQFATETVNS